MNPRELLDNIDNLELDNNEINDIETSEIEISDIVKERVRKRVKSTIRHRKSKKIKIAASIMIGLVSLAVISTPVIASNKSFLSELYKKIGIFDDFEDYKKFIGTTKEDNGFKVTLEEVVATPNTMLVAVKIESPTPFLKNPNDHLNVGVNLEKMGMTSASGYYSAQYIDDYNCLIITEVDNDEGLFPEKSDISIEVSKFNKEFKEELNIIFDINADFTSAFRDVKKLEINKSLGGMDIKSITSSIIESNLFVDINDLGSKGLVNAFIIDVDGRYHYGVNMSSSGSDAMIEFKTLKYSEINEAENISIIYTGLTEQEGILGENIEKDMIWEEENGVAYPKEIISNSNNKYEISKVERDSDKVKLYIEGDVLPVDLLTKLTLYDNSEVINNFWQGTMYKEGDNNYVVEFNDVNYEGDLKVGYSSIWKEKNIEGFQEIKIR